MSETKPSDPPTPSTSSWTSLAIRFANIFIIGFAVDGVLSALLFALEPQSAPGFLLVIQRTIASLVYTGATLIFVAVAFCARLPMSLMLGLVVNVYWLSSGGAPLPLFFDDQVAATRALCLVQLGVSALVFWILRRKNRGDGWLLREANSTGPAFSFAHSSRFIAVVVLIIAPLTAGYLVLFLGTQLEVGTERFVRVDLDGIQLADRRYVRGDEQLRLVAMMHLGEDETYYELTESFVAPDTIVLEEGVSDEHGVLTGAISYDRLAQALGLRAQRPLDTYLEDGEVVDGVRGWPVMQNADVDVSRFSDETLEMLGLATAVWAADDVVAAFLDLYRHSVAHPEQSEMFLYDILEMRNQYLLGEITNAFDEHQRVIVPWGALHLPGIESEILRDGFVLEEETLRRIVGWETLLASLMAAVS